MFSAWNIGGGGRPLGKVLNRLLSGLRSAESLRAVDPLVLSPPSSSGRTLSTDLPDSLWGTISGTGPAYSWVGKFLPSRTGTAYELNNATGLSGMTVWLTPGFGGDATHARDWRFEVPKLSADREHGGCATICGFADHVCGDCGPVTMTVKLGSTVIGTCTSTPDGCCVQVANGQTYSVVFSGTGLASQTYSVTVGDCREYDVTDAFGDPVLLLLSSYPSTLTLTTPVGSCALTWNGSTGTPLYTGSLTVTASLAVTGCTLVGYTTGSAPVTFNFTFGCGRLSVSYQVFWPNTTGPPFVSSDSCYPPWTGPPAGWWTGPLLAADGISGCGGGIFTSVAELTPSTPSCNPPGCVADITWADPCAAIGITGSFSDFGNVYPDGGCARYALPGGVYSVG